MLKHFSLLGTTLLLGLTIHGCQNEGVDPLPPDYVLLTSKAPQTAVDGLVVSYDSIRDYRCPYSVNIQCVWQGDAEIYLKLTKGQTRQVRLTLNKYLTRTDSATVQFANQQYAVVFKELNPIPGDLVDKKSIQNGALLRITRL